jgi:hypothetical protein
LLSIDIDGDDYHILASLSALRPRVIICEYNHTVPYWLDIYQKPGEYFGASVAALIRMAKEKGYRLVCITDGNCIFVVESEYKNFEAYNTHLNDIASNDHLNFIITNYSGKYLVHGRFPFGVDRKYAIKSLGKGSAIGAIKSNVSVCNTGSFRSVLKLIYDGIIKPVVHRQNDSGASKD